MLAYFCLVSLAITVVPAVIWWTPRSATQWLLLAGVGGLGVASRALIFRAYRRGEASFYAPFAYYLQILAGLTGLWGFYEVQGRWNRAGAAGMGGSATHFA